MAKSDYVTPLDLVLSEIAGLEASLKDHVKDDRLNVLRAKMQRTRQEISSIFVEYVR